MNNVSKDYSTCSGCGLCESVCPKQAIEIVATNDGTLRPFVSNKCVECGLCLKYCPGRNIEIGEYKCFNSICYGHSNDNVLRKEAASGGIITELLSFLLRERIVDYVITADEYHCDMKAEGCVIYDWKELYKKAGSNYCPVNIGKLVEEIIKQEGKCAIVSLPCLARGIDQYREQKKELQEKIKFIFSPLCNHVPSYNATEFLIKNYRIKRPVLVKYRGDGWFGKFRAFEFKRTPNGSPYAEYFSSPYAEYFSSPFAEYFWQKACIECRDHFGVHADACFGDADFVKYRDTNNENLGETICFIKNQEVQCILKEMEKKGIVCFFEDISDNELEWIYGPLCNENRADSSNLEQDYHVVYKKYCRSRRNKQVKKYCIRLLRFGSKVKCWVLKIFAGE